MFKRNFSSHFIVPDQSTADSDPGGSSSVGKAQAVALGALKTKGKMGPLFKVL